jgi:hypothetical protein
MPVFAPGALPLTDDSARDAGSDLRGVLDSGCRPGAQVFVLFDQSATGEGKGLPSEWVFSQVVVGLSARCLMPRSIRRIIA